MLGVNLNVFRKKCIKSLELRWLIKKGLNGVNNVSANIQK
jgi:hypothetical protein